MAAISQKIFSNAFCWMEMYGFRLRFHWHLSARVQLTSFLHDRPWISPWIKSISNELEITIQVIASQLSGHCDVISNRLLRHQQNEKQASETWGRCVKIVVLSSFMEPLCRVRNKIMYVLSRWTVSALTRVLIWCLFPSLRTRCFATREINTKITLSWALKLFATRVQTLFCISSTGSDYGLAPTRRQAIIWINDGYITEAFMRNSTSVIP